MKQRNLKESELSEIPEDWEVQLFSEGISVNPKRELKKGIEVKFVSMKDLKEFEKKIQGFSIRKYNGGPKFINGDTLMARITPCLENGKTAYVDILKDVEVGFGSTEFIVLSAKKGKTIPQYVFYLAMFREVRKIVIKSMTGTSGRQRAENDIFEQILVCLPPIWEQESITRVLRSFDDKIELNQQMNKTLEKIGQTLFKHWFIDFEFPNEGGKPYKSSGGEMVDSDLGQIPKGWQVRKVGEAIEIFGGTTPSTKEQKYWERGAIHWATPKDLSDLDSPVLTDTERKITPEGLATISSGLLPAGTVLLSSRAPIGYTAISQMPVSINQGFIAMVCNHELPNYYVFSWVQYNLDIIKSVASGTTFEEVNKTNFRRLDILVPPPALLSKFSAVFASLYECILNNSFQSRTLVSVRDSLLPKLMSGQIKVPAG